MGNFVKLHALSIVLFDAHRHSDCLRILPCFGCGRMRNSIKAAAIQYIPFCISAPDPTHSPNVVSYTRWAAGRFGQEYFEKLSSVGVKGRSRGQTLADAAAAAASDGQPEEHEPRVSPPGAHEVHATL